MSRSSVRSIAATALALGVAGAALASPAQAASLGVGTFNMAGGNGSYGEGPATPALAQSIRDRGVSLVFMQEFCSAQAPRLRRLLGWSWTVKFVLTKYRCVKHGVDNSDTPVEDRHGSRYGIGIAWKANVLRASRVRAYALPSRGLEPRKAACVAFVAPRRIFACSTHFSAETNKRGAKARRRQARRLAEIVRNGRRSRTVLIGADHNAIPAAPALNALWSRRYGHRARGGLREADSGPGDGRGRYARFSGEATHSNGKIDYLWLGGRGRVVSADATHSRVSDHAPLWATIGW